MTVYNIGLNAARTIAYVTVDPEPLPGAATIVLTDIEHGAGLDAGDDAVHDVTGNHVLFHHVRDLLYKRKASDGTSGAVHPYGMYDLSRVSIQKYGKIWDATALVVDDVPDIEEEATETLVIAYHPSLEVAVNTHFTYASDDTDVATVSSAGVVTGVAAGEAVITVTQANSGLEVEVPITVVVVEDPG